MMIKGQADLFLLLYNTLMFFKFWIWLQTVVTKQRQNHTQISTEPERNI